MPIQLGPPGRGEYRRLTNTVSTFNDLQITALNNGLQIFMLFTLFCLFKTLVRHPSMYSHSIHYRVVNSFGPIKRFSACLLMIIPVLINQFKYLFAYLFYYRPRGNCILYVSKFDHPSSNTKLNISRYFSGLHFVSCCEIVLCFCVVLEF
jgi:hypothetical protein